ncbi:primase 1D-like protein [Kriegella aquimaris]|uniref:Uncharacterized protein n=1 Tax=Kriegella aquimaris TaxID=192904 RepID=A0A1G9I7F5_9FLAO|nr:hypothetical protein [Kriegella aquimaris]SDL21032.1 hypothetical protein SAMN04488514_10122 [Kriegella aquimaris]
MNSNIFEDHPIRLIIDLIKNNIIPENSFLNFSRHIYSYKTQYEKRELFQIKASELSQEWFLNEINKLEPEWELTFHSDVSLINDETKFLPLIDFNIENMDEEIIDIITDRFLKQKKLSDFQDILHNLEVFESGSSYHGYAKRIVTKDQWFKFTIAILLLNYTKYNLTNNIIVDTRWVAHRLLSGYTCLRWSNNSNTKSKLPTFYRTGIIRG